MVAQIVSAAGAGGDGSWRSAPAARQRARGAMYATRCLAQALVCSCAAGEGGFHTGLSLLWAIAPPRRSLERRAAQGLVPACGRACVCTPRWRHSPAWRLPARRPRGDRDQRTQTGCPRNHHHFRLQPQHRSSAALIPPATRLARVAPQQGGRRPCLVVRRCRVQKSILGQKNAKTTTFPTPEITVFRPLVVG